MPLSLAEEALAATNVQMGRGSPGPRTPGAGASPWGRGRALPARSSASASHRPLRPLPARGTPGAPVLRGPAPDRPAAPSCSPPSGVRRRALDAPTVPGSSARRSGRPYRSRRRLGHGPALCPARPAVAGVAAAAARSHAGRPPASPQAAPARSCLPRPGSRGCSGREDAAETVRPAGGAGRRRAGSAALGPQRPLSWRFVDTERTLGTAPA